MLTLSKEEFETEKDIFYSKIREGGLFIHPTDTIYGIGCDATNNNAVFRVREVKKRHTLPFSVIAPSKKWIEENCETSNVKKWLSKLPGPYTLILKMKNKSCVAENVNMGMETLGVRIPDHWISQAVKELGMPIVTTSANITQADFMTSDENLDPSIEAQMEFIVYDGEKHGKPSKIVDLTGTTPKIKER